MPMTSGFLNIGNRKTAISSAPTGIGIRLTDPALFTLYLANESAPIMPGRRSVQNTMVGKGVQYKQKSKGYYFNPAEIGWEGLLNDQIAAVNFRRWLGGAVTPTLANGVYSNDILQDNQATVPMCSNLIHYSPNGGERFIRHSIAVNSWEITQPGEAAQPTARFGYMNTGDWKLIGNGLTVTATSAVSATGTNVPVQPLQKSIPQGASLTFGATTVVLSATAYAGTNTLNINPSPGAISNGATATYANNEVAMDTSLIVPAPTYNTFHGAKTNLIFSDGVTTFNLANEGKLLDFTVSGTNNMSVMPLPGDTAQDPNNETQGFVAGTELIQTIQAGMRCKIFLDGNLKEFSAFLRDSRFTSCVASFKSDNIIGTGTDRAEFNVKLPVMEMLSLDGDTQGKIGALALQFDAIEGSATTGCLVEGNIKRTTTMLGV